MLMPLPLRERLTMLLPPSVFYRQRIAQEARTGDSELAALAELMPHGGIAVDVGANVGFFAYALADISDRVSISARCSHLTRRLSGPALERMRECAHFMKAEQPRNLGHVQLAIIEVTNRQSAPQLLKYFGEVQPFV